MTGPAYRFGTWELDLSRRRLLRGGAEVALRPKAFDVLAHLVQRHGRLVGRQELLAAVWPDVSVCDTTLATTIHEVRATLLGNADRGIRLRTAHGRGYLLEAEIQYVPYASEPAPSSVTTAPHHPGFVGRRALVAEIGAAFDDAGRGFGHAFLLVGEAGIGKSSTLLEVAHRSRARGLSVHTARCLAGDATPPAWPWADLLRSVLASCPNDRRRALERRYAGALELVPELAPRPASDRRRPDPQRSAAERFLRFDALVALLHERSREQVQVLLLDDLQCADATTVQLLRHVILTLTGVPLVVLGALREEELAPDHPLEALLAELHGVGRVVALEGLEPGEIGELAAALSGQEAKIDVVQALHAHTAGNPLYATEVVRALAARHGLDDATAVEDAIPHALLRLERARLARLGPHMLRVLEAAAALGASFGAAELRAGQCELPPERVSALLGRALYLGVLVRDGAPGRLRFARAFTRELLRQGLLERSL